MSVPADTCQATHMLRPLPRPVRAVRHETMASYLHRLAAANRLDTEALRSYVAASHRKRAPIPLNRLAVLSGQQAITLSHAIHEYQPRPSRHGAEERTACESCAAARGIHETVIIRFPFEHLVCRRHKRWVTDTRYFGGIHQLQLARYPEILRANRLHRRIVASSHRPESGPRPRVGRLRASKECLCRMETHPGTPRIVRPTNESISR